MKNMQRVLWVVILAVFILIFAHTQAVLADAPGQSQADLLSNGSFQAAETPVITVVVTTNVNVTNQPAPSGGISTPALIIIILVVLVILVGIIVSSRTHVHHVD